MGNPRLYDGLEWSDLPPPKGDKPFPPVSDGDGSIYVSVASYRDGERCGETIKSIFENAKDPSKIIVGLVEQNAPEDKFCLEAYCETYGASTVKRERIRADMVKVVAKGDQQSTCPHFNQIRLVAFYHIAAKGPMHARSMNRKSLGNEEFCMQVDAHTTFVQNWDTMVVEEWKATENEFGVISTAPAPKAHMSDYLDGDKVGAVPRQCKVFWRDNGFPDYASPADALVQDLEKPLMAHAWSPAFSFAKCHLEESVPYDPFAHFAMPIEAFSRFGRMWTRGYDVYTPTRNIVFHDYEPQTNGHGNNEWFKRQRERFRKDALERVKTAFQFAGGDSSEAAQANLGLYGIGKRRTLKQLLLHSRFLATPKTNNKGDGKLCVGHEWIPYDAQSSPIDNLFDKPDNLDPQPEYPLRTKLVFYKQAEKAAPRLKIELQGDNAKIKQVTARHVAATLDGLPPMVESPLPTTSTLFILWVFGLMVWCVMYMNPLGGSTSSGGPRKSKKKKSSVKDV